MKSVKSFEEYLEDFKINLIENRFMTVGDASNIDDQKVKSYFNGEIDIYKGAYLYIDKMIPKCQYNSDGESYEHGICIEDMDSRSI